MDRQCASGLMAIATAAKQVMVDGMQVVVAGVHVLSPGQKVTVYKEKQAVAPVVIGPVATQTVASPASAPAAPSAATVASAASAAK